jgi:hypothetical protein
MVSGKDIITYKAKSTASAVDAALDDIGALDGNAPADILVGHYRRHRARGTHERLGHFAMDAQKPDNGARLSLNSRKNLS